MNKGMIGYVVAFSLGAAVGAFATYKYLSNKCEQVIQEEIKALRERLAERADDNSEISEEEKTEEAPDTTDEKYEDIISSNGYVRYGDVKTDESGNNVFAGQPYVISPEAFGMKRGYETLSLFDYRDGILADVNDEVVENIDEIIGDALDSIGEYEADAVHVRNDELKKDFDVLVSSKYYSDIVPKVVPLNVED